MYYSFYYKGIHFRSLSLQENSVPYRISFDASLILMWSKLISNRTLHDRSRLHRTIICFERSYSNHEPTERDERKGATRMEGMKGQRNRSMKARRNPLGCMRGQKTLTWPSPEIGTVPNGTIVLPRLAENAMEYIVNTTQTNVEPFSPRTKKRGRARKENPKGKRVTTMKTWM